MAKLKPLSEVLRGMAPGVSNTFYIIKKGKKYLTFRNEELFLSQNQMDAILFDNPNQADNFIANVTIDSRNARIIGNSYDLTDIYVTKPQIEK